MQISHLLPNEIIPCEANQLVPLKLSARTEDIT